MCEVVCADVTNNSSINREVNTDTNYKSNKQTTSGKKNDKTTVNRDKDDSNLILIIIPTEANDIQNNVNTL